ncbi:MAG: hypothetical protein JWN96_4565 [Mycobacterium sp.]|jgi:uncharacterized protein (TIGR02246 family)|nr:hypothetical protein [Mycobacterium sp.]
MTTTIPATAPAQVARDVLHRLETAWNGGDGEAFGAEYTATASFVTIRGEHITGATAIGQGHGGIFRTIYAGSVNTMELAAVQQISEDVLITVAASTLDCPTGPLVGIHRATSTSVLVRHPVEEGRWQIAATQNTLVTA